MFEQSFLKYFPVPKYLQFPAVGFDVSDGSVKFIELIRDGDGVEVGRFGRQATGGDLVGTLSRIQKDNDLDMVSVSIPDEESFFVRIRLPFIKPEEVRGAIELQLEEYIPYPANEVYFDHEILKTQAGANGFTDVNVSVLPKKILDNYLDIFKRSKLRPVSIILEAEATSLATVAANSKEIVMVINIGRTSTVLSIITKDSVWFSYTFNFGGDIIVKGLQQACSLTSEAAEKAKNEKGLINSPDNQEVFGCLLPMISGVRDEIIKHARYWTEHRKDLPMSEYTEDISRIIVCGSQSMIPGLTDYLSTAIGLKAALVNPWMNVFDFDQYIPPIKAADSLEYATAIGLALNSLQ